MRGFQSIELLIGDKFFPFFYFLLSPHSRIAKGVVLYGSLSSHYSPTFPPTWHSLLKKNKKISTSSTCIPPLFPLSNASGSRQTYPRSLPELSRRRKSKPHPAPVRQINPDLLGLVQNVHVIRANKLL